MAKGTTAPIELTENAAEANERPAIDTAIDSVRRSRNAATRQGDRALVAVLLRCEAALLEIAAFRAEQGVLAGVGGADGPG